MTAALNPLDERRRRYREKLYASRVASNVERYKLAWDECIRREVLDSLAGKIAPTTPTVDFSGARTTPTTSASSASIASGRDDVVVAPGVRFASGSGASMDSLSEDGDRFASGSFVVVEFKVQYHTVPGQELLLVGSKTELGAWDVRRGVPLRWTPGNNWVAEVELPHDALPIEYKYVVSRGDEHKWEHGNNHVLRSLTKKFQKLPNALQRIDSWSHG